ncbi:recombinase family protein [Chryseobacterium indologenes]|uniref:recombinase family protein n=1 Tax=Chryseobacterium indologenes TaxID=253 RepID=UPI001623A58E|nr:recombinase family protein [Chryseobacterium indologenes]
MNENVPIKVADLYIRIPTLDDSNSDFLYQDQLYRLKNYCLEKVLEIGRIVVDRGSAGNFERSQWSEYQAWIEDAQNSKSEPRFLLFTSWDRFSRNSAQAYNMIEHLESFMVYPKSLADKEPINIYKAVVMGSFSELLM